MIKQILVLFTSVFLIQPSFAQKAIPKTKPLPAFKGAPFFETTAFNFGQIEEQNGKVATQFKFTNIGKGNLTIRSVETSCGCTVSDWPKEPLKPGAKGIITVEYDPLTRIGEFNKTLTVVSDGDPGIVFLTIKGEVYTETMEVRTMYPLSQGHLRFTNYNLQLRDVSEFEKDSIVFTVYNASKRDLMITKIVTPEHITTKVYQKMLTPGNVTDIIYYFDAAKAADLGPRIDQTFIYTTDDTLAKKLVTLKTNIKQDFRNVSEEQKKYPPVAAFKQNTFDYGEVYYGEIVSHEFVIENKGKSDLRIRKAESTCGCTVSSFSKEPIKKGKTGKIKVTFNAGKLRGVQEKSIVIYTNDPSNQFITLKIKAKVVLPGVDPLTGK